MASTAGDRFNGRRHTNRRAHIAFAHDGRRKRIRPLLFLEIGDRRRILFGLFLRVCDGRRFVSEHHRGAQIVPIGETGRVDEQRPAILSRGRKLALDTKCAGPKRL